MKELFPRTDELCKVHMRCTLPEDKFNQNEAAHQISLQAVKWPLHLAVICFDHKRVYFVIFMDTTIHEKNAIIQKYTLYSTVPNKRGGPNSREGGKNL